METQKYVNSEAPDLQRLLARFGLTEFRPGQEAVISTVLAGRDALCVMPTGGGKSLCYQLPAVANRGVTLVVSPLIALMKDQVDYLTSLDLPVTFINSTISVELLDDVATHGVGRRRRQGDCRRIPQPASEHPQSRVVGPKVCLLYTSEAETVP